MSNTLFGRAMVGGLLAAVAVIGFSSCASSASPDKSTLTPLREHTLLDADWRFHRGDVASNLTDQVVADNFDEQGWQRVHLPHDYVLDGSYATNYDRGHGYLPYPPAWYRKHFVVPEGDNGKTLQLQFDGIFRDSKVWLNGQFLGEHKSGYTPCYYDVTKIAKCGADNIITVRVDPQPFEGWWYEGGGIYRHVYFNALEPLHVATWGTYVTSFVPNGNQGADDMAEVIIQTDVQNDAADETECTVQSEILDSKGAVLKTVRSNRTIAGKARDELVQHTELTRPSLWSPESPALYQLRTTLLRGVKPIDSTTTTFGIRTIYYDANRGFFLNGKHVEIYGVANHQDYPAVGIATPDSLQPWRVTQLKKLGVNGWRTAHNPPNEIVLDCCDRLGMMVMDENRHLGYCYNHHSPTNAKAFASLVTNFDDLADMIQRDRNHPSIIMWSMCNEEPLQGTVEGASIFTNMMAVVHRYDKTRPITSAMNAGYLAKFGDADVEDIIGANYSTDKYHAIHKAHPTKPMFGSESANFKTARGEYAKNRKKGWESSYNLTDPGWLPVVTNEFMAGMFTWTGFDYRGEPNPDGWPDVSNNTGLLDMCGFPKDKGYYLQTCWWNKPVVHIMPMRWNWPGREGKKIRVIVSSNTREVELLLNDKSLGRKTMVKNSHVEWDVPYAPGRLVAKGYSNGKLMAWDVQETVGPPARVQLSCDWKELQADAEDTAVAQVSILDAKGRVVPMAGNRVTFHLIGEATLVGVNNGDPSDHDPDRSNQRDAFNGHCVAVVQAGLKPGTIRLTATSPGLAPSTITLSIR